jgi:hypothetical protein
MVTNNSINAPTTNGTAIVGTGTGYSNVLYTNVNDGDSLAYRDLNGNCSFNNVIETTTTTISSGQTVVMTAGSSQNQFITGSSTIQFNLPDATTLIEGWTFVFNNLSTGIVTINQQNGSTLVTTVLAGGFTEILCTDNTTVQGLWNFHNALGTGSLSGTLGTTLLGFVSANTVIPGYTTTTTAAGTTTLTVSSAQQQYFTGTLNQTVVLPVTSTLVLGQSYTIVNNSTGVITVQSSGANTIQAMAAGTSLTVTCILTSGTTAASWNGQYTIESSGSSPLITTYTSGSGTWTPNVNTTYVEVWMYGGGAGGASGNGTGAGTSTGGAGGGAGGCARCSGNISVFSPSQSYSIGTGGLGGASSSSGFNAGSAGNNTTFGNIVALGAASPTDSGSTTGINIYSNFSSSASDSSPGGSSGQTGIGTSSLVAGSTNLSYSFPTGGGGGGGGATATGFTGGAGGGLTNRSLTTLVANAAGGISGTTFNGSNGLTQYSQGGIISGGFSGGGGCGATATTIAGNGGNGSVPGGGGGGGGGGLTAIQNAGAGGNGADGMIIVFEYF